MSKSIERPIEERPIERATIVAALDRFLAERADHVASIPEAQLAVARIAIGGKTGPATPTPTIIRTRIAEIDDLIAGLKQLDAEIEYRQLGASIEAIQLRDDEIHNRLLELDDEERVAWSGGSYGAVLKGDEVDPVATNRAKLNDEVRELQAERQGVRQRLAAAKARLIELETLHPNLAVPHQGVAA